MVILSLNLSLVMSLYFAEVAATGLLTSLELTLRGHVLAIDQAVVEFEERGHIFCHEAHLST